MNVSHPVLLISYLPFQGREVNGSTTLATAIAADPPEGVEVIHETMPVYWDAPKQLLPMFCALHDPSCVIGIGEHGNRLVLFERLAKNAARRKDERDLLPNGTEILQDGEFARFSQLPFNQGVFQRATVPVRESFDAGDYLCNCLLYEGLGILPNRFGFVHVPIQGKLDSQSYLGTYFFPVRNLLRQIVAPVA